MKHKLDEARFFRNGYKTMRNAMMTKLTEALKQVEYNQLDLDDVRGSLIYNAIDDQESEVITSIELRQPINRIVVWVSVYGDAPNDIPIEDLSIELLLNVMDAVEEAFNQLPDDEE